MLHASIPQRGRPPHQRLLYQLVQDRHESTPAAAEARVSTPVAPASRVSAAAGPFSNGLRDDPMARFVRCLLRILHERRWLTWEQCHADSVVLQVTNAWPDPESPTRAPFLKTAVDGLTAAGVQSDVLYVRGYSGLYTYLAGAVACLLLPLVKRYQLVHGHAGEAIVVARCYLGSPVIGSYWGTDILGYLTGDRFSRIKRGLRSLALRLHSLSLSASTTKTSEMHGCLPKRSQQSNVVIPDGVDHTRFRPMDRNEARRAIGWPLDEITVITVGRRDPVKRLDLAEAAAAEAAKVIPNLVWRAVSEVPPKALPHYYNAADLLLHTSASEGSPNVVKEALACNLPVVATAAGDIPALLNGVTRATVAPPTAHELGEAIVRCVKAPEPCDGRAKSQDLAIEHVTARMLSLYRSLGLGVENISAGAD